LKLVLHVPIAKLINQPLTSLWTAPKRAAIHRSVKHVDIPIARSGRNRTVDDRTWPNGDIESELLQIIEKLSRTPNGIVQGGKSSIIKEH
jgi:hypothetical protein